MRNLHDGSDGTEDVQGVVAENWVPEPRAEGGERTGGLRVPLSSEEKLTCELGLRLKSIWGSSHRGAVVNESD